MDLRYVENWSLSLDLVILLRTLTAVVRPSGVWERTDGTDSAGDRRRLRRAGWPARAGDAAAASCATDDGLRRPGAPARPPVTSCRTSCCATELARWRPADAVLSEEARTRTIAATGSTADRVWIVDPLDGTREFAEEGRADWAVHVALCGRPAPHRTSCWPPARSRCPAQHRTLATDSPPAYPPLPRRRRRRPDPDRGQPHPAAGVPRRAGRASSAPSWCRWARPARRSPR